MLRCSSASAAAFLRGGKAAATPNLLLLPPSASRPRGKHVLFARTTTAAKFAVETQSSNSGRKKGEQQQQQRRGGGRRAAAASSSSSALEEVSSLRWKGCRPLLPPSLVLVANPAVLTTSAAAAAVDVWKSSNNNNNNTTPWTMGASERQRRFIHFSPRRCGVVTFTLADIGEGIAEVELLKLHKKLGDDVEEMEGICEVQSDKAAVEITSRYSGRIVRVHHEIGDRIKIGEAIVDIEVEDEETGGAPPSSSTPPKGGSGGGDDNKHTMSSSSPSPPPPPSSSSSKAENSGGPTRDVTASPAVRRLARELHVDLTAVQPTGKGGRVTAEDVQKFSAEAANRGGAGGSTAPFPPLDAKSANSTTTAFPSAPSSSLPPRPPKENVEVPLRGFARAMVKSMTDAVSIPHLNIGDEYDVTELLRVRALLKAEGERNYGTPLTVTPFIIKAVSLALKKFPILNSKIASSLDKYTIYGSHNISLAIDTPHGLVVPNIKDVQDLNLVEVQSELLRLQKLAAANQLSPADLTGGTFSVSNVGVISGTYVHPLLFDGQACIMGIGRTMRVPRFDAKGNVVPRDVMNCAYSADHRHCDGATVARFNAEVKRFLEEPSMMLMTMN